MFATTLAGGMVSCTVPDICKTVVGPADVPIPYPNMGMPSTGEPPAERVFIAGSPALTLSSKIVPTQGDQPGASGGGGVVSSEIMGEAAFTMGSLIVRIEGKPAVRMADLMTTNANNTLAMDAAPSQTVVMANG